MDTVSLERAAPGIAPAVQAGIADCDIHPVPASLEREVYPFLDQRWQANLETFGAFLRVGLQSGSPYMKGQPDAARADAWPPGGGRPGSSLDFMRKQHLDPNNVRLGILNPLRGGHGIQNLDLAAAFATAINKWQVEHWTSRDDRLKASVVVPSEDGAASAREIDRWAGNPHFAQVLLLSRTADPLGSRRYWPIYEAAARADLPVAVHAFGFSGYPATGGGWPSFYLEEMCSHAQSSQSVLTSMVVEGIFARWPKLRVVMVESGFGWLPPLAWRLDKIWKRLKQETPHLTRLPSEYIHDHVWISTQPMEEPEPREHAVDTIDWIGWDRVMFATDYPHWDYDDPMQALPVRLGETQRRDFLLNNALRLYGKA